MGSSGGISAMHIDSEFLEGLDEDHPVGPGFCAHEQGWLQMVHATGAHHWISLPRSILLFFPLFVRPCNVHRIENQRRGGVLVFGSAVPFRQELL